jgi:hypothetical protein
MGKSLVRIDAGSEEDWGGDTVSFRNYCYSDDPEVEFDRHGREIEVESRLWGHLGLARLIRGFRYKKGRHEGS